MILKYIGLIIVLTTSALAFDFGKAYTCKSNNPGAEGAIRVTFHNNDVMQMKIDKTDSYYLTWNKAQGLFMTVVGGTAIGVDLVDASAFKMTMLNIATDESINALILCKKLRK